MKIKFYDDIFLKKHIISILNFYNKNAYDSNGGFFHSFLDDGTIFDKKNRHIVSSTRFIYNYANAFHMTQDKKYINLCKHGLKFLNSQHKILNTNHFAWQISEEKIVDGRAMAYGHAFVMLAGAWAFRVGIDEGKTLLDETWNFMDKFFWEEEHTAYADERSQDLKTLNPYRGQNANMHAVEALLAAFEATGEDKYIERSNSIAYQFTMNLAEYSEGQVWEHYSEDWKIDWQYNKEKPDDTFKPWGFQPGHQVEWAKLLLQLDYHFPQNWHKQKAIYLFDEAIKYGMDEKYGGIVYGYSSEGKFTNANKYFWVQAEALAASWRLYIKTNNNKYYDFYISLWKWCWNNFIDHQYGGWFSILNQAGEKLSNVKSTLGKTDYHTMGACWDILSVNEKSIQ